MNGLRRALLAAYGVLLALAAVAMAALAWDGGSQLDIDLSNFRAVSFIDTTGATRAAFTALMAVLALLGLFTAAVAFLPDGPRGRAVRLRTPSGQVVEVTAAAMEANLRELLEQLPDVTSALARITFGRGVAHTSVSVEIQPGANIAYVNAAVAHAAAALLRDQAPGLVVARPEVRIDSSGPGAPPVAPTPPGGQPAQPRIEHTGAFDD
jgi:hypothetical protein